MADVRSPNLLRGLMAAGAAIGIAAARPDIATFSEAVRLAGLRPK